MPNKETRSPGMPVRGRPGGPPKWALAAVAGIVGSFALATSILSWIDLPAPFDNAGGLVMWLFGAMCVAIIVVIVASKLWEARRAAAWPQAAGRIVKSTIEARHDQFADEATTVTNVPVVEYEFAVAGTTYRGTRISIGEDSGGANTDTTLARYPVAAAVMVYYDPADPADPANCVLERDIPRGFGRGCALLLVIGAIVVAGVYWLATSGTKLVAAHLPEDANAPLVVLTSAMGAVVLASFFAGRRISRVAAGWPVTPGTIVISSTRQFISPSRGAPGSSMRRLWNSAIRCTVTNIAVARSRSGPSSSARGRAPSKLRHVTRKAPQSRCTTIRPIHQTPSCRSSRPLVGFCSPWRCSASALPSMPADSCAIEEIIKAAVGRQ
jgi:Protein of unknown function (DUF3592)